MAIDLPWAGARMAHVLRSICIAPIVPLVILWCLIPRPAGAADPSTICNQAAALAADRTGVPLSVLKAIALTETGRKGPSGFRPWPWTVNMEGKGVWFDTPDEALAYAYDRYRAGARSFDIGCFQINFKYHGEHFASIEQMFDPLANALYAARFLKSLHAETGDWTAAAGAYHSRTPEFADRYAARFDRIREDLRNEDYPAIPVIPDIVLAAAGPRSEPPRINRYPLLQTGGTGGMGSLVPIENGTAARLFGAPAAMPAEGF